jgi:hypothetical protein
MKSEELEQKILTQLPELLKICKKCLPQIRNRYSRNELIKIMADNMIMLKTLQGLKKHDSKQESKESKEK